MPKGRARTPRGERPARLLAAVRLRLLAAAACLLVLLCVWEFNATGEAGEAVARLFGPRDLSARAAELDRALDAALVKTGILDVKSEAGEREGSGRRWRHWEKRGTIPASAGLIETNLALTRAARAAGGRIVRVSESGADRGRPPVLELRFGIDGIETHRITLRSSPGGRAAAAPGTASAASGEGRPRIAIVIDDFGYNESATAAAFLSLGVPVTISVLPGFPHSAGMAKAAREAGQEVLVHLAMEPEGYPELNPGEGALLLSQTEGEVARLARAALVKVPEAVGMNNHMGSAFMKDRARVRAVMAALKDRGLFFVDSMTTPQSVGCSEAVRAGVPVARNSMFIDSRLDELGRVDVEHQLRELEAIARRSGAAVGIAHPTRETLRVLRKALPAMAERGIEFVPVSRLVG